MNTQVKTVLKKGYPVFVRTFKVGDLDKSKCSSSFLAKNFPVDKTVNVRCYENGTLDLRGKKLEYRIIPIKHD